jgi:hypothetical protein
VTDRHPLSPQQKRELCLILQLGCDRTTAQNYLGLAPSQLRDELVADPAFAQQLQRAEAAVEVQHMRNIYEAAKDEKNWRTSVWWLERRAPERFGRRDARSLSAAEWQRLVRELADILLTEIAEAELRARLFARLEAIGTFTIDQLAPKAIASTMLDGQLSTGAADELS